LLLTFVNGDHTMKIDPNWIITCTRSEKYSSD
jgi:hypothetical protein